MSARFPIISVTGSSGAGTTTVKHTFDQIFRREGIRAVSIEGDAFHRYDRAAMAAELQRRTAEGDQTFSHFSYEANVLDELWIVCKQYNADMVLMYDQISCKGMDGLRGVFEEQAAARGVHMLWVAQDLLDSRTISKRDMRRQVNLYMQTVMGEEPVRPDLVDFDDALTW